VPQGRCRGDWSAAARLRVRLESRAVRHERGTRVAHMRLDRRRAGRQRAGARAPGRVL